MFQCATFISGIAFNLSEETFIATEEIDCGEIFCFRVLERGLIDPYKRLVNQTKVRVMLTRTVSIRDNLDTPYYISSSTCSKDFFRLPSISINVVARKKGMNII